MRMYDVILKKRRGEELSKEEIDFFIQGFTRGEIPDYQASALLMSIFFNSMNKRETADFTMSMVHSGETLNLDKIQGIKVDKHSTGGVGDTTTILLAPMVASCGVPVAKMSGRGLGHTGGTIDKLESFKGFSVELSEEKFMENVNDIGIAVIGQTANLAPADKKLYALRDVTATVDNMPLIASSIMSKKIASGADGIVLDVKVGDGAFMKTPEDAKALAEEMVSIGKNVGRNTIAVISDMDQPLGYAIGNALEIKEAIVKAQGGDPAYVDNTDLLPKAKYIIEVKANKSGTISKIHAEEMGLTAMELGAGRATKESVIDLAVGIVLCKKRGEKVSEGDILARVYANDENKGHKAVDKILNDIQISDEYEEKIPLIYDIIR